MGSRLDRFPLYEEPPQKIAWVQHSDRLYVDPLLAQSSDARVYRYATLAEAFGLISRGEWTFARPSEWPDKYEKHIAEELFDANRPFENLVGFVKCVSFEYSSEAMWRTYSSTGGLVRLSWSLADLLTTLQQATWPSKDKIYVAPVRYLSVQKLRAQLDGFKSAKPSSQHAKRALLMKRDGFAFENEIRISYLSGAKDKRKFITAKAVPSKLVQRILVDPYLGSWQAEEICHIFQDVLGVKVHVAQSKFDTVFTPSSA
jgi:hypothetical protein